MTHADTSYLVDLMRGGRARQEGPARRFLDTLGDETLFVSDHAVCELFAGVEVSRSPASERRKLERLEAARPRAAAASADAAATYCASMRPRRRTGSLSTAR